MPGLARVHVPALDTLGPELRSALVAVSPRGTVLFTTGFDTAGRHFTAVDTAGVVVARFGRTGSGPGEFRNPFMLRIVGDTALVYDQVLHRVVKTRLDGRHPWNSGALPNTRVMHLGTDSVDVVTGEVEGGTALDRISLRTQRGRRLVVAPESLYADRLLRSGFASAYGGLGDGIVLADPYTYRMQAYDGTGQPTYTIVRDVPPRRRTPAQVAEAVEAARKRERTGFIGPKGQRVKLRTPADYEQRLAADSLRHFPADGAIRVDARGRTWVIGQVGDSTFADVFARERFLGRIVLPCNPGSRPRADLNGEWLALVCRVDDEEGREVELQLHRITDAASG